MTRISLISGLLLLWWILMLPIKVLCQKIGIGTAAPTEKLHVAGNIKADTMKLTAIKISSNAAVGKVLTSDASGNGTWQTSSNSTNTSGNVGYGVWGNCDLNANISEYTPLADPTAAYADFFGSSVAVSGNYLIAGAPYDDVGTNVDQGSVCIYQFNGTNWVFMQKITDPAGAADDQFGYSVSISGNFAIVGVPQDVGPFGIWQGSVNIYQLTGGSWVFKQRIFDATGVSGDAFGVSVSISGNYAIVGAPGDDVGFSINQGSASIYQYNGTSWVLMKQVTNSAGSLSDMFGSSVSISGNRAVVGVPLADYSQGYDQGAVVIFQYNGSNWVQVQTITEPGLNSFYKFGSSVSVDGDYIIVGVPLSDISSPTGRNDDQGSANIFWYNGSTWLFVQELTDPGGKGNDNFGNSVFISGDYAIAGNLNHDLGNNPSLVDHGAAVIYQRIGVTWQQLQYLVDPAANAQDLFGFSVCLDGNTKRFVVGARRYASLSGKIIAGKIN